MRKTNLNFPVWTRRSFHKAGLATMCAGLFPTEILGAPPLATATAGFKFTHPGMLHSANDLDRMKNAVANRLQPVYAGFEVLRDHPQSQADYVTKGPFVSVGRNPTIHSAEMDSDANASYQLALMGHITGSPVFTQKSIAILDAWAITLQEINGLDAVLCAGLGPFKFLNAAEIVRYTTSVSAAQVRAWQDFFRKVLVPVLINFSPFANGNWDTAAIKTLLAVGVFCEDRVLFERALQYLLYGCGNGRIPNYIYPSGQCQESGRDQQHTQLGIAHIGDCSEIAWHQGLNLYGAYDNRLLTGFEYTAKYLLGEDVPFSEDHDRTGKYTHVVNSPRSALRACYEQIYNHYVNRARLPAPFTQRAAEKIRPEGAGFGADEPGFGTLTCTRPKCPDAVPALTPPAALRAVGSLHSIRLEWLPAHTNPTCTIFRADHPDGPYLILAQGIRAATYEDATVRAGLHYTYRLEQQGRDAASLGCNACAGLSAPWKQIQLGAPIQGKAWISNDSRDSSDSLHMEAGGTAVPGSLTGDLHYVGQPCAAAFVATARLQGLVASAKLTTGWLMRPSDGMGPSAALLLAARAAPGKSLEHPSWSALLVQLSNDATPVQSVASQSALGPPTITNGRVTGDLWLRLQRTTAMLTALTSSNGKEWTIVGTIPASSLPPKAHFGLCLTSGLGAVTTEVIFDHIVIEDH
jgi:Alginate lyase